MQQTETYKLNKPEMGDKFSLDPLNENADKMEGALERLDAAAEGLDQRVQVLELRKFASGCYKGDNTEAQFIDLGFTPQAVFVSFYTVDSYSGMTVTGSRACRHSGSGKVEESFYITENGFMAVFAGSFNSSGTTYHYFAMG